VESPGRKELAQVQWLEHDLFAKVVSTFADHALEAQSFAFFTGIPETRLL
jgi:hypothetical protein